MSTEAFEVGKFYSTGAATFTKVKVADGYCHININDYVTMTISEESCFFHLGRSVLVKENLPNPTSLTLVYLFLVDETIVCAECKWAHQIFSPIEPNCAIGEK